MIQHQRLHSNRDEDMPEQRASQWRVELYTKHGYVVTMALKIATTLIVFVSLKISEPCLCSSIITIQSPCSPDYRLGHFNRIHQ